MFGKKQLTALQLRKELLLLESQMNRLALQNEIESLREVGNWTGALQKFRSKLSPWTGALAAGAGVLAVLGFRRSIKSFGWLRNAVALLPSLIQLWRTFAAASKEEPADERTNLT